LRIRIQKANKQANKNQGSHQTKEKKEIGTFDAGKKLSTD